MQQSLFKCRVFYKTTNNTDDDYGDDNFWLMNTYHVPGVILDASSTLLVILLILKYKPSKSPKRTAD